MRVSSLKGTPPINNLLEKWSDDFYYIFYYSFYLIVMGVEAFSSVIGIVTPKVSPVIGENRLQLKKSDEKYFH